MGLNDVIEFFKTNTINTFMGTALPYYTVRDVSKIIKKDSSSVRKNIKYLVSTSVLIEHPLNTKMKVQKFRLNREKIGEI